MSVHCARQADLEVTLRILHVISGVDARGGGPAMAMIGLCKAQRDAGLEVAVLATWRRGDNLDIADDLRHHGLPVTLVGPVRGPLSSHRQLAPRLREGIAAVDVVHVHGIWEDVQYRASHTARSSGKPYIVTPHGMLTSWSLKQKRMKKAFYLAIRLRRLLHAASAIHYTSEHERAQSAVAELRSPALVEPLGIDLREFQNLPDRGTFRAKHAALADRKIVVFLGRLHPGKGMEYLVPAMAQVRDPSAVLVAVGPDSAGFQASIERQIEALGLRSRVLLVGMLRGRERLEALVDADVFALPSEHENFGVAAVEALACGTPVVLSEGVAIHREIVSARAGAVAGFEPAALAQELDRWLADPALRQGAGERARALAFGRFGWPDVAARWVEHYRALTPGAGVA